MRVIFGLTAAVLFATTGSNAQPTGKWGDLIQFPLVPVAAALLPDGKVSLILRRLA
jgi:hypothetical protein